MKLGITDLSFSSLLLNGHTRPRVLSVPVKQVKAEHKNCDPQSARKSMLSDGCRDADGPTAMLRRVW